MLNLTNLYYKIYNKNSNYSKVLNIMEPKNIIQKLMKNQPISQNSIQELCRQLMEVMAMESNLLELRGDIKVIGDVHGQFFDVLKMFQIGGKPPTQSYLFLGDYVDRGYHSLQTFLLLACYKLMHPEHIHLLRGNHQSRQISSMYGFYEQIQKKYGSVSVWKIINQLFDYLPLAAVVNGDVFCVHGGLSPEVKTIQEINDINRVCQIPTSGGFGDLVWSDPDEIEGWMLGSRGVGWLFGNRPTTEFLQHNRLKLIVRSHQLVQAGYQTWFKSQNLVTIWSAPNYCYRCGNKASIMKIPQFGQISYQIYTADERSLQSIHYRELIPYFL